MLYGFAVDHGRRSDTLRLVRRHYHLVQYAVVLFQLQCQRYGLSVPAGVGLGQGVVAQV